MSDPSSRGDTSADQLGHSRRDEEPASEADLFELRSLLYRASHAQRQLMHPYMAAVGLGTGQPKLLSYLYRFGACSQRDLAEYYELDPAGVSRMLDALAKRGFVQIAPAVGDKRSKTVTLTAEGERVARAWDAACCEEATAMLRGFAPEERRTFADYLARAHANLKAYGKVLAGSAGDAGLPMPADAPAPLEDAEPAQPAAAPEPAQPAAAPEGVPAHA